MMKRIYDSLLADHFVDINRQMAFVSGPGQVGKTTTSQSGDTPKTYLAVY
jgi:predicted AAA+ superfamily ATPase